MSYYSRIARFITRPSGHENSPVDIIVGACFKDQGSLKPNHVYEFRDVFGTITLHEVGESWIPENKWGHEYQHLMRMYGNHAILSAEELESLGKEIGDL